MENKFLRAMFWVVLVGVAVAAVGYFLYCTAGRNVTPGEREMGKYQYLANDGGPDIILPLTQATHWLGSDDSDYQRACAVKKNPALIKVGSGQALVIPHPPLLAWAKAPGGGVDFIVLQSWKTNNPDALIEAAQKTCAGKFSDTGIRWKITDNQLVMQFAGDPGFGVSAYNRYPVAILPGICKILKAHHQNGKNSATIYRLKK